MSQSQRRLAFLAAVLFLLAGLTGMPVGMARSGALDADADILLGAHSVAIIGALWMLGVAWSLPMVRLGPKQERALVALIPIGAYGNWLITAVKSFLHVRGVAFDANLANNAVVVLLTLFVVVPTMVGCALWAWGLRARAAA